MVKTVEIGGRTGCHSDEEVTSGLTEKASWPRFYLASFHGYRVFMKQELLGDSASVFELMRLRLEGKTVAPRSEIHMCGQGAKA